MSVDQQEPFVLSETDNKKNQSNEKQTIEEDLLDYGTDSGGEKQADTLGVE